MRLSVSDLWTDALALLRAQREILIALGGFFFLLPPLLMAVLAPFESEAKTWPALAAAFEAYVAGNFPALLAATLLTSFGQLAILALLLDARRMRVADALKAALISLPLFMLLVILINLMLIGGALLLIIPALYLYGRTMLAAPAFAAEGGGNPVAAIGRSFALTHGNGWRLFALAALIYFAGQIVAAASGSVIGSAAAIAGGRELALFAGALVEAVFGAITAMLLLLVAVAAYRRTSVQ